METFARLKNDIDLYSYQIQTYLSSYRMQLIQLLNLFRPLILRVLRF
jgi:hypothetical protein